MGHISLGRIPKTRKWSSLFQALEAPLVDPKAVAAGIASATEGVLRERKGDRALSFCFWLLVRVTTASRSSDFVHELNRLGVKVDAATSGLSLVQQVSRAVEQEFCSRGYGGVFARMAELALRDTLSANIVDQSRTLFGTKLDDVQAACYVLSTRKQFGEVGKEFFAAFVTRVVEYVADKEISNHVGRSETFGSPAEVLRFQENLGQYCLQSAKIVEDFAGGWFSKHNWEANNEISERAVTGFTAYALDKLQMELREAIA
jgi:hypothetical protein